MANSVVLQTLEDGPNNTVIKATIFADTSDIAETVIANPALLAPDPMRGVPSAISIAAAKWAVQAPANIALRFQWKATANTDALTLGQGTDHQNFRRMEGPIQNDSGAGKTGSLVVVTTGWAAGQILTATVILTLQKTTAA